MEYNPELNYEELLMMFYYNKPNKAGDTDAEEYQNVSRSMKEYERNWRSVPFATEPEPVDYNIMAYNRLRWERNRIRKDSDTQVVLKQFMKPLDSNLPVWMVTINYPDTFSMYTKMKEITVNIGKLKWVETVTATYEYYTDSGCHPHTHMKIQCNNEKMCKSDIVKAIYQVKDLQKYISDKASVDVRKSNNNRCDAYLQGDKCEKKLANVAKDKEWRIKNNLE